MSQAVAVKTYKVQEVAKALGVPLSRVYRSQEILATPFTDPRYKLSFALDPCEKRPDGKRVNMPKQFTVEDIAKIRQYLAWRWDAKEEDRQRA